VPYLIEAMRVDFGKPIFPTAARDAAARRTGDGAGLPGSPSRPANDKDFRDIELRMTLLDIVKQRDDARAIPYLWHMYESKKKYPDAVRKEGEGGRSRRCCASASSMCRMARNR